MKFKNQIKTHATQLCDEVGPDDGIDPRKFFSRKSQNGFNRKNFQLCKQIQCTLNLTLAGEMDNHLLRELMVTGVEPCERGSRYRVTITTIGDFSDLNVNDILQSLQKASGQLRMEVARSIHRKRVPELTFQWIFPQEVQT